MDKWYEVKELIDLKILDIPMDGNHGESHPVSKDFVSKGIPFIMSSDINDGNVDYINCKFLTKEHAQKLRKGFSKFGDVLLTHKASIGRTAINNFIDEEFILLTPQVTYYRILDNEKLNNKFLKYFFDSTFFQKTIKAWSDAGSTRAYIGITKQLELPIFLPNIRSQKKIVHVLSALDDKIEVNNKINGELEAMAKTLYDYWFVQFDFPNAHGKPYKSSGGEIVYNPILKRDIPKDWAVMKLDNCIDKIIDYRGRTPKKMEAEWSENSNDIIAISAKHIKQGKLVNLNVANRVDIALYSKWMKEKLSEGDILMTSEAPCGEFFYLIGETEYCLSQRVFAIRSDSTIINHSCLYFELSFGNGYSQIMGKVSGSTVFGIRQDELRTVNILIPEFNLQNEFSKKILPIYRRIRNNEKQNQELAALRDWLLPLLMNGQVKVNDVEDNILGMVAEAEVKYEVNTTMTEKKSEWYNQRFELWLSKQGLAARGEIDKVTLRELFDAMNDDDK